MISTKKQQGFSILAIILMMVVLVTAVSFLFVKDTDINNTMINSTISHTVVAQAGIVRSRVLACGIEYPTGNNGTAFRVQYPAATVAINISALTCPGAANANLWTLMDGLTLPQTVSGFNSWQYTNDAASMRLTLTATSADRISMLPTLVTALGVGASSAGNTLTWILVQ
jgi:hypothetical protein